MYNIAVSNPIDKLRLLFLSHDAGMFGAQRTLLTLLTYLDRERIEPYLVVPNDGPLADAVRTLDIPVIRRSLVHWLPCKGHIEKGRAHHYYRVLRGVRSRVWAIARLIDRYQVDVVYSNTITCVEGALAARITHRPHVWHIHEPIKDNSELVPGLPAWFYALVARSLSATVIFPSQGLASTYPLLNSRSRVVYNGLQIPDLCDKAQARLRIAKATSQDQSLKFVAVVGALQPRKDHFNFLKAAKLILDSRQDARFLVVGAGSEQYLKFLRDFARELGIEESVIFMGWWPHEIHELLRGLDILVISSEQESFGLTAIEAMAMEVPVVATRCGGPEEIVIENSTGFLVPRKNPRALADAMSSLLDDPERATRFGIQGREVVERRFNLQQYVRGVEDVILGSFGSGGGVGRPNADLRD